MVPLEHMVGIIDINHCGLIYVIEPAAKGGPARQNLLSWVILPTSVPHADLAKHEGSSRAGGLQMYREQAYNKYVMVLEV